MLSLDWKTCEKICESFRRRALLSSALCLVLSFSAHRTAYSEAPPAPPHASQTTPAPKAALVNLARQFVEKIGGGMHRADIAMGLAPEKTKNTTPDVEIPDGADLILQAKVNNRVLQGDMIAHKDNGKLFVSLRDFFGVLGFPIRVDPEQGHAEGWFIRENRPFTLDMKSGTVSAGEKNFSIQPGTIRDEEDDWLVSLDTLGAWFDMTFETDLARQSVTIKSAVPLPFQERDVRHKRRLPGDHNVPPPAQPRQDPPRLVADAPFVDVSVTASQRKSQSGTESVHSLNYSTISSGDILGMTGKSYISGDLRKGPTSLRASLERNSENPDLLGPAKARQIALGDVRVVDLPIVDGTGQEQGAFISNRKKGQAVTFASTEISGDAQANWDVELYRGDQLVGFQSVDESGRYSFPDVKLFSGANDFRLVFYGPQGELREERQSVPVDLDALESGKGFYDVSLTRTDKVTYQKFASKAPDVGTPHFAANYEKAISDTLVANGGVRLRQEGEKQKSYAVTGLSALFGDTFVNANAAYDLDGEAAAELIGRRNLGKHRLGAQAQINTSGFSPDSESTDPTVLTTDGALSGPLFHLEKTRFGYALEAGYNELASGASNTEYSGNINVSSGPWRINNTIGYEKKSEKDEDQTEILDHANVMALMGRNRYRLSAKYEIKPEPGMQSLLASWLHKYSQTLNSEIEIEHILTDPVTKLDAHLNWSHKNFTIGPHLQYDTDGKLATSVTARMGLARNPQTGKIETSGRGITGYGGLSALVFIDNDGDGIFGEGDEPAEGVKVEAPQSRRFETTGPDGVAFLANLPESRPTDILVDSASFPDPYLVSDGKGFSIVPRPGRVAEGTFPLHHSGEIDGTVTLSRSGTTRQDQPASGLRLYLYDGSGRKVMFTKAAYDGFYLFSLVPPGEYTLLPDAEDLKLLGGESPMPKKIKIGYDGTVLSGVDMKLAGGDNPVTIGIADDFAKFLDAHADEIAPGAAGSTAFLNLGTYKSRLMLALVWYRLKTRYGALVAGNDVLIRPSQAAPDENGKYVLRLRPDTGDLETLRRRCRAIAARGVGCGIEILPSGLARENGGDAEGKSPG